MSGAHAQASVSISLSPSTVYSVFPKSVVTTNVVITNLDQVPHMVSLSIIAANLGIPSYPHPPSFTPNPVNVSAGGVSYSVLTIWFSAYNFCPAASLPGPYNATFIIQGSENGVNFGDALLQVNLFPPTPPITLNVNPTESSYEIGDPISLAMSSTPSVGASYSLTITKPDGTVWASTTGMLPDAFSRLAEQPTGQYTVLLKAVYCGTFYASTSFTVGPKAYNVFMNRGEARVLQLPIGTTNQIQVDPYADETGGSRYYCEENNQTVNGTASITFSYSPQYYLDLRTNPASIQSLDAKGWYASGAHVPIPPLPTIVEGTAGVRFVLVNWTIDGEATSQNGFQITMNAPHTVIADYKTQYLLIVNSAGGLGDPKGSG